MRLKNFSLNYGVQVFKSFSDEARVRILNLLLEHKELTITDLEHILEFTQTKTSRHITYLRHADLVSSRKADQWVFYFVRDEMVFVVSQMLGLVNKDGLLQKDLETYRILYSNRELAINKIEGKQWTGFDKPIP